MPEIPTDLAARAELLRELSRDGGSLSPDSPLATCCNPKWFSRILEESPHRRRNAACSMTG